jgi:hypothetical protein
VSDTNDIVERMRFWAETRNNNPTAWNLDCGYAADEIDRLRAENAALKAERDALAEKALRIAMSLQIRLKAERDALKANDPLAEMWRELAEYQPFADRDGHGESWRRMCEERTNEAAWAAEESAWDVEKSASWAARCAADAALHAFTARDEAESAIDEIRKAREGER